MKKIDYPYKRYQITIITTQKEFLFQKSSANTIDLIKNKLAKTSKSNISCIHYPEIDGYKAEQLNYAFSILIKKINNNMDDKAENIFFCSFDADSTIHSKFLKILSSSIEPGIDIYQQPMIWLRNINKLQKNLSGFLMQGFAINQTFHSLAYEIPMLNGWLLSWRLKYFLGNGLCIRATLLKNIKGYPPLIEDTRLGRITSLLKMNVKTIPVFGVVDTAKSLMSLYKQASVWFVGCNLFYNDYLIAKSINENIRFYRFFLMMAYGIFKSLRWMNKGLIHIFALVYYAYLFEYELLLLTTFSLFINAGLPAMLIMRDSSWLLNKYNIKPVFKRKFLIVLISTVSYIINFVGQYLGLFKIIKLSLFKIISLPKTER